MDTTFRNVLRTNHRFLVNHLDLNNTQVLDHLRDDGTISAGEQDEVLAYKSIREQNAKLLYILKRRCSGETDSYSSFLNALKEDYDFIYQKLKETENKSSLSRIPGQQSEQKGSCVHCSLIRNLIPKDVTHQLFEDRVISDDDLDAINSENTCRRQGVKRLLDVLDESSLPQEAVIEHFVSSLKPKYNYIVSGHEINLDTVRSCQCKDDKVTPSTTNQDLVDHSPLYTDKIDTRSSASEIQKEIEFPVDGNVPHNTTTSGQSTCRRKTSKEKMPKASHEIALFQQVPKSFPNDKKLMRLCSKLWNKLFFLREKGDWHLFHQVSEAARSQFVDRPDIQVVLHRSDMCIHGFYKDNSTKALDSYEKALELLPSTSMPDWHLARILPLKIELCTRSKQFDEASSLLKDAHQAMCTLTPCLSSGAVYFFEALYLGAILRCTKGGTKSLCLKEQVKTCFLTAIKHYEQEKYFEIKSFLNQVYLFLALFALGVDFKQIQYIRAYSVSSDDVALAKCYLDLFENNCWGESTEWSRMLFYIARAEEHKQRGGYQRALDYLNDALKCTHKGRFEHYKAFIERNAELLQESITEKLRLNAMKQCELTVSEILASLDDSSSDSC